MALANPLATSGVPMRVYAAPFKGRGRDAIVPLTVEIDAAALGLTPENGQLRGTFDLRYLATDARRKVWPEVVHTASVDVKPEKSGRVPLDRVRVRVVSEMELPKGRYQLRVAAGSALVAGNVVYDLEVPDFTDGPMTVSGVALVDRTEPDVLTLRSTGGKGRAMKCYSALCAPPPTSGGTAAVANLDSWLGGRLPGPPTTVRDFAVEDEVTLVVEVYDNAKRNARDPHTITLTAELRTAGGALVPLASRERAATAPRSPSGGHAFDMPLRFRDVPPGAHVLRIQARSGRDASHVAARELPIRLR
jgi:hypothetical protein